jgi:tetratricopeptide repeat protein 30
MPPVALNPPSVALNPPPVALNPPFGFGFLRCFLALIENLAKHMIMVKDTTFLEIMNFLDEAERHGKKIATTFNDSLMGNAFNSGLEDRTVASEARILKRLFLKLRE